MDLTNLRLFAMAARSMDWLSKRQVVLSQNIANADTPGYRPEDLKKLSFQDLIRPMRVRQALVKDNPMDIAALHQPTRYEEDKMKHPYETTPSGNSVDLEQQLAMMSETQADHRLAANLYTKQLQMIRMALGSPPK